jgi:hypothetical protein
MKKLRLLLLDANIIIKLFHLGIWDQVVDQCDVQLARTVVEEAHFFKDEYGDRQDFDLKPYDKDGKITVFDITPPELTDFRSNFDSTYLEKLDLGEAACLTSYKVAVNGSKC